MQVKKKYFEGLSETKNNGEIPLERALFVAQTCQPMPSAFPIAFLYIGY